ncbi:MAG: DUF2188 domain-containing protein [Clostridia bacterium]|nr:DUF2188 domain-containing protein [Clostridia bacterium]MBQ8792198.1 DUF2188 domain-containing protein [Clostridia bacterium]
MWFFGKSKKKKEAERLAAEKAEAERLEQERLAKEAEEKARIEEEAKVKEAEEKAKKEKQTKAKTAKKEEVKEETQKPARKACAKKKQEEEQVKEEPQEETSQEEQQEPAKTRKAVYRVVFDKEADLWKIKKDGAKRVVASKKTKDEALAKVQEICAKQDAKFVVYKKDGKFQKKANLKLNKTGKEEK